MGTVDFSAGATAREGLKVRTTFEEGGLNRLSCLPRFIDRYSTARASEKEG